MNIKNQLTEHAINFTQRLSDVRFVGQLVFVIIVLLISWSGVKSIQTNYNLQKQINSLHQQNNLQKLANQNMALDNQYYNSQEYLELAARKNFGLAKPGEKEVLVPKQVALSYTVNLPGKTSASASRAKTSTYQRNFQSWVDFFLNRQQSAN